MEVCVPCWCFELASSNTAMSHNPPAKLPLNLPEVFQILYWNLGMANASRGNAVLPWLYYGKHIYTTGSSQLFMTQDCGITLLPRCSLQTQKGMRGIRSMLAPSCQSHYGGCATSCRWGPTSLPLPWENRNKLALEKAEKLSQACLSKEKKKVFRAVGILEFFICFLRVYTRPCISWHKQVKLLVNTAHVLKLNHCLHLTHCLSSQQNPQVRNLKQQQDVCPQHTGALFASTWVLAYPVPAPARLHLGSEAHICQETSHSQACPGSTPPQLLRWSMAAPAAILQSPCLGRARAFLCSLTACPGSRAVFIRQQHKNS